MTIAQELVEAILRHQAMHDGDLPKEIRMSFNAYRELRSSVNFLRYQRSQEVDEFYGIPITIGNDFDNYRLI